MVLIKDNPHQQLVHLRPQRIHPPAHLHLLGPSQPQSPHHPSLPLRTLAHHLQPEATSHAVWGQLHQSDQMGQLLGHRRPLKIYGDYECILHQDMGSR